MARLSPVEQQVPIATNQRRVWRARRRAVPRPVRAPRARPRDRSRRSIAVNPVRLDRVEVTPPSLPWWKAWSGVGLGIAGVALAVRYLTRFPQGAWLAGFAVVAAIGVLAAIMVRTGLAVSNVGTVRRTGRIRMPGVRIPGALVFFATLATGAAAIRKWEVDLGPASWDVGAPWLAGIVLFGLLAWWPIVAPWLTRIRSGQPRRPFSWPPIRAWAPWVGLMLAAALLRLPGLGRYPAFITGDEGQYLLMAVSADDGTMVNPFSTGWLEVPLLYPAVAGWLGAVFGGDLAAYRLLGGLVGTVGVLATWRFGRYVVGPWPALAGAGLLAALPFHLVFSRSALNQVLDPTSLVLVLLFLWRAVHTGRRGDAFVCGVMLGLGWYGYWGARAYPVIVTMILVIMATDRRLGWFNTIRLGLWSALGFVVTAAPLLVSFAMHPTLLSSRFDAAAPKTDGGWGSYTGSATNLYLDNVRESMFFPFVENVRIWFRNEAPFFGWPVALLIAVGVAAWIAVLVRERAWREGAWLVVPWAFLTLGLAATNPIESQRFIALAPIWMLLAGCAVVALARWGTAVVTTLWPVAWRVATVGVVVAVAAANLAWVTSDARQFSTWGDTRSYAAWDVGWRLAQDDANIPVTMVGAPYMYIGAWQSLRFMVPEANLSDAEGNVFDPATAPPLPPGTLLLLVMERAGERCQVEAKYPDAMVAEVRARDGTLLYLAFYRGDLPGWATGTSPEGTTWALANAAECRAIGQSGARPEA